MHRWWRPYSGLICIVGGREDTVVAGWGGEWSGSVTDFFFFSSKSNFFLQERSQLEASMAPQEGGVWSIVLLRWMVLLSTSQTETTSPLGGSAIISVTWIPSLLETWVWGLCCSYKMHFVGAKHTHTHTHAVVSSLCWGFPLIKWHQAPLPFFILKPPPYSPIRASMSEPDWRSIADFCTWVGSSAINTPVWQTFSERPV